jgi:nucleoside-diphosphate-sugar epimerase
VHLTPVHIIGASGRSGAALCRSLSAEGLGYVPVVRDAAKWSALGFGTPPVVASIDDAPALRKALAGSRQIVCCAHASHVSQVLAGSPPDARFVFLGSTRKFTRWPDAHGAGVITGETAFLASARPGVMLHPTMIYGATGEDNVQRLAALLRRLPIVPLPGGGRSLVQPIHQDDVTHAIRAALNRDWDGPKSIVIAGPEAVSYAGFVGAVAAAVGLPRPRIVSVPAPLLMALASSTRWVPGIPYIRPDEVRRLLEDKAFDITEMREGLQFEPIALAEGLARTFSDTPLSLGAGAARSDSVR